MSFRTSHGHIACDADGCRTEAHFSEATSFGASLLLARRHGWEAIVTHLGGRRFRTRHRCPAHRSAIPAPACAPAASAGAL